MPDIANFGSISYRPILILILLFKPCFKSFIGIVGMGMTGISKLLGGGGGEYIATIL